MPDKLEGWTLGAIQGIVSQGVFESRLFDFKESLPADERGKTRLRKSLAAFANSSGGGFLVFGVKDDRGLPPEGRIVGVDATLDLPEHLNALSAACVPRPQLPFRNPPHRLASGRLVHVVHVLEGNSKPHGVFDGERWVFPKRTDGGNDLLSYEEIRDAFRDQRAFRAALVAVKVEADRMARHAEDINRQFYHPSATTRDDLALLFRPALMESLLMQVLGHLDGDGILMSNLALLRGAANAADTQIAKLLSEGGNMDPLVELVLMVLNSARQVSSAIERKLGPSVGAP